MKQMTKIKLFEAAWTRYVEALQRRADEIEANPRKANSCCTQGSRVVRMAHRNLRRVCAKLGETCPA